MAVRVAVAANAAAAAVAGLLGVRANKVRAIRV